MDPRKQRNSSGRRHRSGSSGRRDTINLSEEKLPVRRGKGKIERVAAGDLILEGMIERALLKRSYREVLSEQMHRLRTEAVGLGRLDA